MRIPPEKIDEVRQAIDIVDLISGVLPLKKRGKNYVGLCPFHAEKTPSFNVSPDRQMYHCFGCGVGGNVFTFVMEYEKISFVEAVRTLAERAGITLPRPTADQDAEASLQEQLYEICRDAGLFYHAALAETTEGRIGLEYFHRRGFTEETIRSFGLGYSPNSWDAYVQHATEKHLPMELAEKAGLVRKRDDGSYYDLFRGRAMFPIFSASGKTIAFGARRLREDDTLGKYINSPETPIYFKSRVLYGLSLSKESIRERDFAILVEGYADLITVYQAGIRNVVASSGTALTQDQIRLLSRYTRNVTIVYDADSAGSSAALRGVDLLLENDLDVRVAPLPQGDDPDSYVRKNGGAAFRSLVDQAASFVGFMAGAYEREGQFGTPEKKAKAVRTIIGTIARMSDELKRNFYIKELAEKYDLSEALLHGELHKILKPSRQSAPARPEGAEVRAAEERTEAPGGKGGEVPPAERDLLQAMFDGGEEVVRFALRYLQIEDLSHPATRSIIQNLAERMEEGKGFHPDEYLNEGIGADRHEFISMLLVRKNQMSDRWKKFGANVELASTQRIVVDSIIKIKQLAVGKMVNENFKRLKAAGSRGEDTTAYGEEHKRLQDMLAKELRDLESELKAIKA